MQNNTPTDLFNIELLILNSGNLGLLKEIKKASVFEPNSKVFDKHGLFSTDIFGPVSSESRKDIFGYIDLIIGVLHPLIYTHILSLNGKYDDIIRNNVKAVFDTNLKDFVIVSNDDEKGDSGYSFFLNNLDKIEFKETESGLRSSKIELVKMFGNTKSLITKWLVLPAGLRDYTVDDSGIPTEDEVNGLYRKLLSSVSMIRNTKLDESNIKLLDPLRHKLQLIVCEIYEHFINLMDGKNKLLQGKWAKRGIAFGTRNVITPMLDSTLNLKSENHIDFNQTTIGVFQYGKSIAPIMLNKIHSIFINRFLNPNTDSAMLVNSKTLKTELVTIPIKKRDEWLSLEGLNNIINRLSQDDIKKEPIMINDHYLMLIYDDGSNVHYYFNTDEISDDIDIKHLRPITYIELLYMSIYDIRSKYPAFLTRYPVAGLGGIYPTFPYVKTTVHGRTVKFTMNGIDKTVYEYPNFKEEFINSLSPNITHIGKLGADLKYCKMISQVRYVVIHNDNLLNCLETPKAILLQHNQK